MQQIPHRQRSRVIQRVVPDSKSAGGCGRGFYCDSLSRAGVVTRRKLISPGRTGRPYRRARNGAEARTCRAMPRHSVVERSRIAFSMKIFLETAPVEAANSASSWRSANAGGPARPYVSWDRGTKQHAPVPVRPYLSRFNVASADTPVPQAAAATAEDASG